PYTTLFRSHDESVRTTTFPSHGLPSNPVSRNPVGFADVNFQIRFVTSAAITCQPADTSTVTSWMSVMPCSGIPVVFSTCPSKKTVAGPSEARWHSVVLSSSRKNHLRRYHLPTGAVSIVASHGPITRAPMSHHSSSGIPQYGPGTVNPASYASSR